MELQIIVALIVNFLNENLNTILRRRAYCPKTESSAVAVDFEGVSVPVLGLRRCAVGFDMSRTRSVQQFDRRRPFRKVNL